MSALDLAVVLQLAAACAPGVAPETLAAIARTESGLNPIAIGVNGPGGGSVRPTDRDDAVRRATALISQGRSVDLGLMQINSGNLRWLELTVAEAFDPCRSLAAGAAVLTATSRYNTGSPTRGLTNGYVARVRASAALNAGAPARPSAAAPVPPAPTEPPWDVWSSPPRPAPAPPPPADEIQAAPAGRSPTASTVIVELIPGD